MAKNIKQKSMRYDQYDYMKLMESNIPASLVETHHFDSAEDASVFFARELDYVKSQSYDVEYPELTALSLFPMSSEVDPGAETVTYYSYDKVGLAKIISNYATDLPRADVKGNGIARSMGEFAYTEADLKIEPQAAVVLWYNTVQNDRANWMRDCPIILETVKLTDGCIEFSTPETFVNGNVLIAAIDQPLKADEITVDPATRQFTNTNILWSWNLIVSNGYDIDDATQTFTKGGYTFMKRDLGAVLDANETLNGYTKVATQGNMYQWGRKDPLPTIPDYASNDASYMTGLWFTPTFTTVPGLEIEGELGSYGKVGNQIFGNTSEHLLTYLSNESITGTVGYTNEEAMDYATKLPYRWFNASASGDDQRYRWIREYAKGSAIWGNPDGEMEVKTIYDPCPAGWKVASEKAWMALTDDLSVEVTVKDKYFYFSTGPAFPVWEGRSHDCSVGSYNTGGGSGYVIRARYLMSNVEEFYGLMPRYFRISAKQGNYDQHPEAQCDAIYRDYPTLGSRVRCIKDNQ